MRPLATTANKKRPWEKAKTSILLELATNKSSTHSLGSCRFANKGLNGLLGTKNVLKKSRPIGAAERTLLILGFVFNTRGRLLNTGPKDEGHTFDLYAFRVRAVIPDRISPRFLIVEDRHVGHYFRASSVPASLRSPFLVAEGDDLGGRCALFLPHGLDPVPQTPS